ncbi:agmatine hydroxycinnamoyltransferase 1-like [Papaver somniferum]|uniref:agmatine hydroxycinnamoyltransferase 1-like n=1 Tax=Papaver somniferum TaxID=3469 RepID=UPI000E6FB20C|nr:agmatine hydroxycinnamoyltransferase 1-like [Papaver somniferum]
MMNASDIIKNEAGTVEIQQVSKRLLQPIYNGDQPISTTMFVPLTVFDRLADDMHVPILYAYKPPNPSNTLLEQGLRKVLSEYREWAGRFGHRSVEIVKRKISKYSIPLPYTEDDLVQQVLHCTPEFIAMIKSKASSSPSYSFSDVNGGHRPPYSTSVCLVAHLWKVITRVWRLADSQTTYAKISVNGRRRLRPRIPDEFFGNMVLWDFAETRGKNLYDESLSHIAEIIHKEVTKVDSNYYKSYIDFANKNLNDDNLTPRKADPPSVPSCWPNLEIQSWLGFTYNDVDFGVGKHFIYMPSFDPLEAETYLVPSIVGVGSINVYITLFRQHQALSRELFYNIYGISSAL